MRRRLRVLLIMLLMLLMMVGCRDVASSGSNSTNYRDLKIIGDVNNIINLGDLGEDIRLDINNDEVELEDIINLSEPMIENYDILIVGNDGLMARIDGDKKGDCSLKHLVDLGWCSLTEKHPVSTRIKDIKEIVIISNENTPDYGFNIFSSKENILTITPGQLYLLMDRVESYVDGESTKTYGDNEYSVKVFKQRRMLPLSELLDDTDSRLLAFGGKGEYVNIKGGALELYENRINYIDTSTREYIKDLKGILVNPPANSNMDLFYDTSYYLEEDVPVLAIFVDGLGYHQYLESSMAIDYDALVANTVYKPVTNAGFAAMITGKPPTENGVPNRKYRELLVDSIFDIASGLDKDGRLIEGDIKILNTSKDPILNLDKDGDGLVDDDIHKKALEVLKEKPDLVMVHYHSIDDFGHSYGDDSIKTMNQIEVIAEYIKELKQNWKGKIIITSDHGMHGVGNEGSHGDARYEDIIIPYIITEGDLNE